MTMKKKAIRRMTAGAAALALAIVGLGVASSAANAEVGPDQPLAPTSGTLTINKYGGLPVAQGGNLENPLDGVEFTVTPVGIAAGDNCTAINLANAAQWNGLEGLFESAPDAPATPFCLVTSGARDGATVEGAVTFSLPVGVYYVEETDSGDNPIVSAVPNFYVSIPTSSGAAADGWNYNVVADPKNQLADAPSKTIAANPSAPVVGSAVTWTLSIPIPTLAEGETFDSGSVTDQLDSRLRYVSSDLAIGALDLVEGTDYSTDADGVTWTFTPTLLDAHMGESITIELVTRVDAVGNGQIINRGGEDGNYWSEFNGTTVPGGPSPESYWGQLAILKTDDSSPAQKLRGAEFKVFGLAENDTCPATAPPTGAIATGTSDANGVVQWANVTPTNVLGLWIANVDNGPADPAPTRDYCVYETVIPAGHSATPISNPVTISPGETGRTGLTVVNPKKTGPDLPLTGAQGTLAMTIGGLALAALGAGAIVLARRRGASTEV